MTTPRMTERAVAVAGERLLSLPPELKSFRDEVVMNSISREEEKQKEILFFIHIGKSGGGSVKARLKNSNVTFFRCHPRPCLRKLPHYDAILITIRDPVDRFISAFNWRNLLTSCPSQSNGTIQERRNRSASLELCRRPKNRGEAVTIHNKYQSNPNNLAEALCDSGPVGDQARIDLRKLHHFEHALFHWLPKKTWKGKQINAIVQEPGFPFLQQMDGILGNNTTDDLKIDDKQKHSTSLYVNATTRHLSALGTCCMARHLASDYDFIRELQLVACRHSKVCDAAMSSILDRREAFLKNNNKTCHELVSLNVQNTSIHAARFSVKKMAPANPFDCSTVLVNVLALLVLITGVYWFLKKRRRRGNS